MKTQGSNRQAVFREPENGVCILLPWDELHSGVGICKERVLAELAGAFMPATFDSAADSHGAPQRCPDDDLLLEYIPGHLPGAEASSVEAHLQTCKPCQSRITTLKARLSKKKQQVPNEVDVVDSLGSPLAPVAVDSSRSPSVAPTVLKQVRPRTPRHLGEYELIRCIGRGGMGVVYRAVHTRLKRKVAIKLLPHLHFADQAAITRLQREMAAAGRVKHPNLVYALDAGERDGIEYLVLEFVEGIDLGKLVAVLGPLPIADACEVIRQAACGLAHIDDCGLVHRDIKPSNLMLSEEGTVKVLDLGLALLARTASDDEATKSGYLLGTADYVAPEQIDDPHHADVRSDLYSLGCALYKLLAGHAPFGKDCESVTSKLHAQRYSAPPPIRELRPEVPESLAALLDRLLAKEPADRPQKPQEVIAALAPLSEGADLPALLRRAYEHGDLEGMPIPNPSQTPPSASASTHPFGRTPTPQRHPIARRTPTWKLAGALFSVTAIVCCTALAMPGLRSKIFGSRQPTIITVPAGGTVDPTEPQDPAELATSIPRDPEPQPDVLLANAEELKWAQGDRPRTLKVEPRFQMIEASADDFQLIQLGTLAPSSGTITMELDFRRDQGEAGLFFGYHEKNVVPDRLWGVAHFIHLSHLPSTTNKRLLEFIREESQLRPGNRVLVSTVERNFSIAAPSSTSCGGLSFGVAIAAASQAQATSRSMKKGRAAKRR
jgi:serine/threonine protein kinase